MVNLHESIGTGMAPWVSNQIRHLLRYMARQRFVQNKLEKRINDWKKPC